MTSAMPNSEIILFVTHVDTEGPLLKIWGQVDRNAATCVERLILPLAEKFTKELGCPGSVNSFALLPNALCCARFQNEGYYRARICSLRPDGLILVHFIDYGNFEVLSPEEVRSLDGIPSAVQLQTIPPLAIDFVLANVFPVNGKWESETIESIRQSLRYVELKGIVHSAIGNNRFLKLNYNQQDFAELLVSKNMAEHVSLQDMFRQPKYRQQVPLQRPNMQQQQPLVREAPMVRNNYPSMQYPTQNNYSYPLQNQGNPVQENWRIGPQQAAPLQAAPLQRQPVPIKVPEALVFKSRVLEVGSTHDVYVSFVDDGPLKFSVQVEEMQEVLSKLMVDINNYKTQPLQEPPQPGAVCLGRYTQDKVLCRAVVMSVMESKCKLYYVDFGHTEVLPYTDIFQLPPEYINPKVLSIRFTLSGLKDLNVTEEMKAYFKALVSGKKLILQVRPPEGPPLMQYGDLYDNGKNIRDILMEVFRSPVLALYKDPPYPLKGSKEIVHPSFVESCSKFFVQLDSGIKSCKSIMTCLAEYAKNAPPLQPSQLAVGVPCAALYEVDSQWYRAQILTITGDKVKVLYVDFGNEDTVAATALRSIHPDLVTKLRAQAIRCILNGYQARSCDQETANRLDMLILEKRLMMVVIDVFSNGLLVDLFDPASMPMVNIQTMLNPSHGQEENNISTSHSQYDKTAPNLSRSPNTKNYRSDAKMQQPSVAPRQKAKPKSTKAIREDTSERGIKKGAVSVWNQSDESDTVPEKPRTKNWKEDENELRRRDNRYQKGDGERFSNSRGERFNRDGPRNDRFGKNDTNDRFDRSDTDFSSRNGKEYRGGRGGRSFGQTARQDRSANGDKSWSDKDSDTSSKSSGRRSSRGGGYRGGGRGGRAYREGGRGGAGRNQSGRWNDEENDRGSGFKGGRWNDGENDRGSGFKGGRWNDGENDRGSGFKGGRWNDGENDRGSGSKGGKYNGDRNFGGFRSRENRADESSSKIGTWDPTSMSASPRKTPVKSSKLQIPPPNITVGAVKNCEVVFATSPTDFYVQLTPDNVELDSIMANIATTYESGGNLLNQSKMQPGMGCVAQYSEDTTWYRAIVKAVNASNATVQFVDYGNTEDVDFDNIKELEPEFAKLPTQAISCKLLAATKTDWDSQEVTRFNDTTVGKALEAEFVAEENTMYEVLLREVVNNEPVAMYINESFSEGANLTEAKEAARSRGRVTQKSAPDYAPPDSKWIEARIEPGSKEDVIVTWFTNPQNFYCQIISKQAEFRSMMNEIQKVYVGRQPMAETPQVGSPVVALFADDGALYRAKIVELNKLRGHIVQYIDFGNFAMVDQRKIYPVEKKFMNLPKQAVHCTLQNIAPVSGSNWSKTNVHEIDKYFDADKYECIFHEHKDEKYVISLNNNGNDVGSTMVTKGHASCTMVVPSPSVSVDQTTATTKATVVDDDFIPDRIDINLLNGQAVRVKVSSVHGVNKFYVQFSTADFTEQVVTSYMAENDPKVMPRLSCHEVCLGAGCLVYSAGVWRRAVVINCSRTTGFDLRLIDTGAHDEIPQDRMLALPAQLSVMQNQAIECCLRNAVPTLTADEKLKELVEGTDAIIYVDEVDNNRLLVRLYDASGNSIKVSETDEADTICPICPLPILSSTHKVWVSYADNSNNVWLQRVVDSETDSTLLQTLYDYYSVSGETVAPVVGALCAVQGEDKNWYRSRITEMTETGVRVIFIDYGNQEVVPPDALKRLEPQFYLPHQLAIRVSLSVDVIGTEAEQMEILQTHLRDKEFVATFYNMDKKWIVELTENGEKLSEKLGALKLVKEMKQIPAVQSEVKDMIVGGRYEVCVSHANSPSQFWLQRKEEIESLDKMQSNLQLAAPSYPKFSSIPEEGTLCAAIYTADNSWYRAEVLDADEDITTVRFIDYGNTDIIDNKSNGVRQIPDSWKGMKKYAIRCRLDIIPVNPDDWSESVCERFEGLIRQSESPIHALVIADSFPRRVELFINDKSIGDTLVQEGHALLAHSEEDLIDELVELELDPHSAFVSHINSPSEFWVQEERCVSDLEVMSSRFIVADMFPKVDEIKEGALCVAKFPEDDLWYRARVVSHGDSGTEVIYIDYGNSAISTEIRALPEDLAAVPPLSRKCCLPLPDGVSQWSEQACEKFVKLADDGATIFILDVLKEEETSTVKLTLDNESVADQLAVLCDRQLPVIEERLPPLGEENSPNVVVSHVNSPSDFSIQTASSMAELNTMADRLVDAESFLQLTTFEAGTICAGKFPEDGQWYRARILSHGESGTEVLYIDYGNLSITTELRMLPQDIVNIPSLSKCCSLQMPLEIEAWSKDACEKFVELVADGATMFQFEILDDEEPCRIKLNLKGEDVSSILAALCNEKTIESSTDKASEDTDAKLDEDRLNRGTAETVVITPTACDSVELVVTAEETATDQIEATTTAEMRSNDAQGVEDLEIAITQTEKTSPSDTLIHTNDIGSFTTADTSAEDGDIEKYVIHKVTNKVDLEVDQETEKPDTQITKEKLSPAFNVEQEFTDRISGEIETETSSSTTVPSVEIPEARIRTIRSVAQESTVSEITESIRSSITETAEGHSATTDIAVQKSETAPIVEDLEKNERVVSPYPEIAVPEARIQTIQSAAQESTVSEITESIRSSITETAVEHSATTDIAVQKPETAPIVEDLERNERVVSPYPEIAATPSDSHSELGSAAEDLEKNERATSLYPEIAATPNDSQSELGSVAELTVDEIVTTMVKVAMDPHSHEEEAKTLESNVKTKAINPETDAREAIESVTDIVVDTTHGTPKIDKIVPGSISRGMSEQEIIIGQIERRNSIPAEDKIVPGSINKGYDLPENGTTASSEDDITTVPEVAQTDEMDVHGLPSTPKTQYAERIVPGSISCCESPTVEIEPPSTPKTPHSEKLVAGVVNLHENVLEFEEEDETMTISIKDNIPEYTT